MRDEDADWYEYEGDYESSWEEVKQVQCQSCGTHLTLEITSGPEDRPGFREGRDMAGLKCFACGRATGFEYDSNHERVRRLST